MLVHYREGSRVSDEIGTYTDADVGTITGPGEPEQVRMAMVSSGLFDVLGIRPIHGRLPLPEDFEAGARNGVVISHGLWTRRFGADPDVVGRPLSIARMWDITIVGVLAPGVDFPRPDTDIWIGLSHERFLAELGERAALGGLLYGGVARLRPGVSIADAQQDLRRLIALVPKRFPDVTPQRLSELGLMPVVGPLKDELIGDTSSALMFLLIGGVVLLFVAWANVGTLCLARAERLHEEVAVARAIGATQWHLGRRFCVEALALSGAAGLLAYVLSRTAIDLRFGFELGSIPRLHEVTVDGGVVARLFSLSAASAATLALITYARVRYATAGSRLHLTMGRSSPGRRAHASRRALVAAQVAMAVPLVVGSALMAESYWRLSRVELGFDAPDALTLALEVPPDAFRTSGDYYRDVAQVHDRVRRRLLDLSGVQSVESASRLPLSPDVIYYQVRVLPDREAPALPEPYTALFSLATPGYFEAMGIPLLSGRTFLAEDTDGNTPGAVLSASLARTLFGIEDPVGRQIRWPGNSRYPPLWVVGVVGDVPPISIPEGPSAMLYLPNIYPPVAPQMMDVSIYIPDSQSYVLHATTPAAVLLPEVRRIVREVDPTLFVREPGSMAQHLGRSTARTRLTLLLLAVGSGTALFLGMVGLYAVLSHAVGRRRREFGIRLVVGTEARDLTRGGVAEGVLTALAGIAFGLIIARGTSDLLRDLIYGVSPGSPEAFIAVSLLLLGVAAGASYVPARRAARLDPVMVLKAE